MSTKWMTLGGFVLSLMLVVAVVWVEVIADNPLNDLSACVASTNAYPGALLPALRTLESNLLRADVLDGRTKEAYQAAFRRSFDDLSDRTSASPSRPAAQSRNAPSAVRLCAKIDDCRRLMGPEALSAYPHCIQQVARAQEASGTETVWDRQATVWHRFTSSGRLREDDVRASLDDVPAATFADDRFRLGFALLLFQVQIAER